MVKRWSKVESEQVHKDHQKWLEETKIMTREELLTRVAELQAQVDRLETDKRVLMLETAQVRKNNAANLLWIAELQAQVELLKTYTQHKVGCKWNGRPVARVNMFEVIRQPCSCGLHAVLKGHAP